MARTKAQAQQMEEARQELRKMLKPGDTVYCNIRHVSRSGMFRIISLHIITATETSNGKPYLRDINGLAAKAMDDRLDRDRWGLKVGGCGMDMCFATVYNLGAALFPEGFGVESHKLDANYNIIASKRPNSPAHAKRMAKAGWVFRGRNGDSSGWDKSGGYALTATTI